MPSDVEPPTGDVESYPDGYYSTPLSLTIIVSLKLNNILYIIQLYTTLDLSTVAAWKKLDDPPARVEPVPMVILLRAAALCTDCDRDNATIDCIWMAFYFLLRPGEYANASGDAKHQFRLCDVQYKIGHLHIFDAHLTTVQQCLASTFVSLHAFSTQKNGVKGEKLAHTPTGHRTSCPVRATL